MRVSTRLLFHRLPHSVLGPGMSVAGSGESQEDPDRSARLPGDCQAWALAPHR